MGIVLFAVMAIWWMYSLIGPPIIHSVDIGVEAIARGVQSSPNVSFAINNTIVPVNNALDNLQWLAYTLPIVLFLCFIMMCFYVRTYPFLLPIWLAISGVLVFMAILMTSGYNQSVGDDPFYADYAINNFYMSYMPYLIGAVALIGGIVLLVLVSKDASAEVYI